LWASRLFGTFEVRPGTKAFEARDKADRAGRGSLFALVMALNMSVPMAWWMRRRGHGWGTRQMSAATFVPILALIPALWLGAISGEMRFGIQHAVMIPSMIVVLLRSRSEFAG
jgi:hypothetical protein